MGTSEFTAGAGGPSLLVASYPGRWGWKVEILLLLYATTTHEAEMKVGHDQLGSLI